MEIKNKMTTNILLFLIFTSCVFATTFMTRRSYSPTISASPSSYASISTFPSLNSSSTPSISATLSRTPSISALSASVSPTASGYSVSHSPTPTRSINNSPSATPYFEAGNTPCNPVKVKSFPVSFQNNLIYGESYNGTCNEGPSYQSQFYFVYPSFSGNLTISTCSSMTTFDSVINLYNSTSCLSLMCIATNDDGCSPASLSSLLTTRVEQFVDYYVEIRAFGFDQNARVYDVYFSLT